MLCSRCKASLPLIIYRMNWGKILQMVSVLRKQNINKLTAAICVMCTVYSTEQEAHTESTVEQLGEKSRERTSE